jgi:hypothetical protein
MLVGVLIYSKVCKCCPKIYLNENGSFLCPIYSVFGCYFMVSSSSMHMYLDTLFMKLNI